MLNRTFSAWGAAQAIPALEMADELDSKAVLSQATAQSMVAACFADRETRGYPKVTVFVVDDGGHLLTAARQHGACRACAAIARDKAVTSALHSAPKG
ncbi:MAG: heme-binding protein [Granulosicoccus sp.]